METKKEVRSRCLHMRDALTEDEVKSKSNKILYQLIHTQEYKEADTILLYADFRHEVMTDEVFRDAIQKGKKVYYPKVFGNNMEFYHIESLDELQFGYQQIREPYENPLKRFFYKKKANTLMIVPGSAFDIHGHRIGYGKGFYDRYLSDKRMIATVAFAFAFQMQENIPADEHDIKMDKIITEELVYSFLRV